MDYEDDSDIEIVMVKRDAGDKDSKSAEKLANKIFDWCKENRVYAEMISIHRAHLKFRIEDNTDRDRFLTAWPCSTERQ